MEKNKRVGEKPAYIERMSMLVGKEGAFDLLLKLNEGPKSFVELKTTGHSPNTVLTRLREAQRAGLVQSQLFTVSERKKPRIKYVLTDQGQKLLRRYIPVKTTYLDLKEKIAELEKQVLEQKQELRFLLSSIK